MVMMVVMVTVVGYCGSVFVVVAVTPVIRLIESDTFIISLVYSWRVGWVWLWWLLCYLGCICCDGCGGRVLVVVW